jgi:hypothetical protein
LNVWQGCNAVHEVESTPVLEIHTTFAAGANAGATFKKAVRASVTAKSVVMIRIIYRP